MSVVPKVNYHMLMKKELEAIKTSGKRPQLLLHLCCAPCSSYVIDLLNNTFELKLYFYDPNIHPYEEYARRRDEAKDHAALREISFVEGPYDVGRWYEETDGHEDDPEKGGRCTICYDLRMGESARFAKEVGCEYFTTVLSISPHKDSKRINESGFKLAEKFGIKFLQADFKKEEGFKKSIELSRKLDFYRQDYCGCEYSKRSN